MKSRPNAILHGVIQRIRQLLSRFEETKALNHGPTIGSLIEAYLKQFLAEFIPPCYRMTSGFVTDSLGETISPQIDLLVHDSSQIPAFMCSEHITIAPIESAELILEAKSMLRNDTLDQTSRRQQLIRKLRFAWTTADRSHAVTVNCEGIPEIIVAPESSLSSAQLKTWFVQEATIQAICVIGKWFLLRDPRSGKIEVIAADENSGELLHLISFLNKACFRQTKITWPDPENPGSVLEMEPDYGAYLTFDAPHSAGPD